MFKSKITNPYTIYPVIIFFLAISLVIAFFQREFLIYRDFSTMWHGALLVSEGYRPWEDFIMPISPVSIYLVGIFLSFTEKSWLAFQLFQLLMNFLF